MVVYVSTILKVGMAHDTVVHGVGKHGSYHVFQNSTLPQYCCTPNFGVHNYVGVLQWSQLLAIGT